MATRTHPSALTWPFVSRGSPCTSPHGTAPPRSNTATPSTHSRSRRTDSAPHGIGVKTKPAARVDLRSSLDPDPLPAYIRTEPGTAQTGHKPFAYRG